MSQTSQPVFNATPVVLALIAINAGVHAVRLVLPEQWSMIAGTLGGFSPPWFLAAVMGEGAPYTLILLASPLTYAFLHADLLHLALNMAFLLAFGTPMERRLGRGRFLGLYFACALCGAGASLALFSYSHEQTIMVGASGAISGLFGAVLRLTTRRALLVIAIFIGSNVVLGYTGVPGTGEVRSIAWEAHIGGFLAGFVLFPLLDGLNRHGRRFGRGNS
ncbi:MAG: rhomboid family intramembrane serine protease [Proteobacteria bacterium]|nr:rhomboid family intramembrane serine protease [Pseudomonadota bacterium]